MCNRADLIKDYHSLGRGKGPEFDLRRVSQEELCRRLKAGDVVVLDVRAAAAAVPSPERRPAASVLAGGWLPAQEGDVRHLAQVGAHGLSRPGRLAGLDGVEDPSVRHQRLPRPIWF